MTVMGGLPVDGPENTAGIWIAETIWMTDYGFPTPDAGLDNMFTYMEAPFGIELGRCDNEYCDSGNEAAVIMEVG